MKFCTKSAAKLMKLFDETLEMVLSSALRLIEPVLMLIIAGMAILYGTTMMNTLFMI